MDWVGYGPEEHSGISKSLMLDPQLLADFYDHFDRSISIRAGSGSVFFVMVAVIFCWHVFLCFVMFLFWHVWAGGLC